MSDSKLNRGEPDRSKINMNEDYEVQYWTKHLGISREKLQQVVEKVGNSAAAVRKELAA
jgi:3-oxoacyl-[acyl-carrier-protein] synthase III